MTFWIAIIISAHCHVGPCDIVKGIYQGYFKSETACQKYIGAVLSDDDPIWKCYRIYAAPKD